MPEEGERYSPDEAFEEASKIQKKIGSGEAENYNEAERRVKKESQQQDFESLTRKGFEVFKSIDADPQRQREVDWFAESISTESAVDLPQDLNELANDIGIPIKFAADNHDIFSRFVPQALAAILFKGVNEGTASYSFRIKFPVKDMMILEVGGNDKDSIHNPWPSAVFPGTNYTGIDISVRPNDTNEKGYRNNEGKLEEYLQMDVMNVDTELEDRSYDLIFGMAFLGIPSTIEARKSKIPEEYEARVIGKLNRVLRSGGIMFFVNREPIKLKPEDVRSLGFDLVEKRFFREQVLVLRKRGKTD